MMEGRIFEPSFPFSPASLPLSTRYCAIVSDLTASAHRSSECEQAVSQTDSQSVRQSVVSSNDSHTHFELLVAKLFSHGGRAMRLRQISNKHLN